MEDIIYIICGDFNVPKDTKSYDKLQNLFSGFEQRVDQPTHQDGNISPKSWCCIEGAECPDIQYWNLLSPYSFNKGYCGRWRLNPPEAQ